MQSLKNIQKIVKEIDIPDSIADQLQAEIRQLEKQLKRNTFAIERLQKDKVITEGFLNTTIQELEESNLQLREYQQKELEQKEKQIKSKEVQLKQITDAMPSSLAYVDRNYCYQINNSRYKKWFGVEVEDLEGKHIITILGKKLFYSKIKSIFDRAFAGEKIQYEIGFTDNEGKKIFRKTTYVPAYNENGENVGAYVFGEDISILRRQQEELAESQQELEKRNKELQKYIESNLQLESFARLASHDLREPLLNIFAFIDLLKEEYSENIGKMGNTYLSYIQKSSKHMERLINDLLNYSTIGKYSQPEVSSLNELIKSILHDFSATISKKNALITYDDLPTIRGYQTELRSLFQNLISNALKYQKTNEPPIIQISVCSKKDHWQFSVKDNGIGIPSEYYEQVFVIYKRLNNRHKQERSTGIGLAHCKKVVELHEGKIWVTSTLDVGTTFHFTISKHLNKIQPNSPVVKNDFVIS